MNEYTARLIMIERFSGGGVSRLVSLEYDFLKGLNPAHLALDVGWILGSGKNLVGEEKSRVGAVVEFALYLAIGKAAELLPGWVARYVAGEIPEGELALGAYKALGKELPEGVQANHVSQDAVFKTIIPSKDGISVGLRGNILTDAGTPHHRFHQVLEEFWSTYRMTGRLAGQRPTVGQYNAAAQQALQAAGLSARQAKLVVAVAAEQQSRLGLVATDLVPRVPNKIPNMAK